MSKHHWLPRNAATEALVIWIIAFTAILLTYFTVRSLAKAVATVCFLYLPLLSMDRRGEDYSDYGLSTRYLWRDIKQFLTVSAVILPLFIIGYAIFVYVLPSLPQKWMHTLTPYVSTAQFRLRLPDRFPAWCVDQLFVVALPEEFFYRGFIQTRLRDAWPGGKLFLGARLGPAFWVTAVVFALGHLAVFQVWRLAVFFPALIFGWMRERSGSMIGAALFHAASNLLIRVLDASFFSNN